MRPISEENRNDALLVLSFLPYCPCGVTIYDLADDCFGAHGSEHRLTAMEALRNIRIVFKVEVSQGSLGNDGLLTPERKAEGRQANTPHYWLEGMGRVRAEQLTAMLVDAPRAERVAC